MRNADGRRRRTETEDEWEKHTENIHLKLGLSLNLIRFGWWNAPNARTRNMYIIHGYASFAMGNDNRKYYAHTPKKKTWSVQISCIYHHNEIARKSASKRQRKSRDEAILTKCLHMKRMLWLIILILWYEHKRLTMPTTWLFRPDRLAHNDSNARASVWAVEKDRVNAIVNTFIFFFFLLVNMHGKWNGKRQIQKHRCERVVKFEKIEKWEKKH